ncbi:MAG: cytochrome c peroxidase [Myxococcaceae bacterium]
MTPDVKRWAGAALLFSQVALAQPFQNAPKAMPEKLPPGVSATLWQLSVPKGSEPTPEKIALGEKLFMDQRLSADNSVSCATCHEPSKGFVDAKVVAEGIKKQKGQRNSPTVLNALFNK